MFADDSYAGGLLKDFGLELVIPKQLQATFGEIPILIETLPQLNTNIIIVMASADNGERKKGMGAKPNSAITECKPG